MLWLVASCPLRSCHGPQVVQLVFWLAPNAWSITKEAAWFGRFVAISGILRWTSINVVSCSTLASLRHHLISELRCLCLKIRVNMSQYLPLIPHAKIPCIMPKRLVHSHKAGTHELYLFLGSLCSMTLLRHCSSASCLRGFFLLQTMILFVVNGHNTNPWLGKQGEHSRLILQQCALPDIILLLSQTYPRLPADETDAVHRAAAWGEL